MSKYICKLCKYSSDNKKNFILHLKTKKHKNSCIKHDQECLYWECNDCNYLTCSKNHTLQHKKETEQENKKKDSPLWRKILLFWR